MHKSKKTLTCLPPLTGRACPHRCNSNGGMILGKINAQTKTQEEHAPIGKAIIIVRLHPRKAEEDSLHI